MLSTGLHQRRAEDDLSALKSQLLRVSNAVSQALEYAVDGVVRFDRVRLNEVMVGDYAINRAVRALDDSAHAFVALHQPAATSLRTVSSVLRLSIALERIGDYAVTLSRAGLHLRSQPGSDVLETIAALGGHGVRMLNLSTRAFVDADEDLAMRTMPIARDIHRLHNDFFQRLTREEGTLSLADRVRWLTIAGRLERVGDQGSGICKETVFACSGRMAPVPVRRVLFVDRADGLLARIAEAHAARWPGAQIQATSASIDPQPQAHPLLGDIPGVQVGQNEPRAAEDLRTYDVIVALEPGVDAQLGGIPFHCILLDWAIDRDVSDVENLSTELRQRVDALCTMLTGQELMR